MLDDEWANWYEEDLQADWKALLMGALTWFKFPRVSLDYTDEGFISDLNNDEI